MLEILTNLAASIIVPFSSPFHPLIISLLTVNHLLKARAEERRSAFEILKANLTGKRPLGRSISRLEDIRMDLKEIGINRY